MDYHECQQDIHTTGQFGFGAQCFGTFTPKYWKHQMPWNSRRVLDVLVSWSYKGAWTQFTGQRARSNRCGELDKLSEKWIPFALCVVGRKLIYSFLVPRRAWLNWPIDRRSSLWTSLIFFLSKGLFTSWQTFLYHITCMDHWTIAIVNRFCYLYIVYFHIRICK